MHTEKPLTTKLSVSEFFEFEDKLASQLTNSKIESELNELNDFIRTQISRFESDPEAWKNRQLRDTILIKAIRLRRLNRLSNFRNKLLRERLATTRNKVEGHFLQLQNLKSEIGHLRKAIESCLEFQSSDSDIDLVSVEEFYEKAPESISNIEVTKSDPHQLYLARLNYELHERKNILGNLHELEAQKGVLLSDIRGKEQRLTQIKPKIQALKLAAKPLLDILGLKSMNSSTFEMVKKSEFLPVELRLIYINCGVYNELLGENTEKIDVQIDGDVQEAMHFQNKIDLKNKQKNENGNESDENDDDEEEEEEEEEEDVKEEDLEEDETTTTNKKNKRKRKSRSSNINVPISDRLKEKQNNLLKVHPISVSISMDCSGLKNRKITLNFVYLTELRCICIKAKIKTNSQNSLLFDSENILDELFDGDSGLKCPNPVSDSILNFMDIDFSKHVSQIGKPYKFAQKICGLNFPSGTLSSGASYCNDFMDDFKNLSNLQQFELFSTVLTRIEERVNVRFLMDEKLTELKNSNA